MSKSVSLLQALCQRYSDNTKEQNFSLILGGAVYVDEAVNRNPKALVASNAKIEIKKKLYVSRGGYKLEAAIKAFNIDCKDKIVLDAGASTGGFTDCLLQQGAKLVYSVDVGYNQLDYKLRVHPQVVVMERTNIKEITLLNPPCDFVVADLSFRSIVPVLPKLFSLSASGQIIFLLKPQFEVDPKTLPDFDGVVREVGIIKNLLVDFFKAATNMGYFLSSLIASPIKGTSGNREFLVNLYSHKKAGFEFLDQDSYLKLISEICNNI